MTEKENIQTSTQNNCRLRAAVGWLFRLSMLSFMLWFGSFQEVRDVEKEYKLKAAFIYNFIQYIDWSATAPKEYIVGVLGYSPIEADLREIAAARTVGDKKIVIKHFDGVGDISDCNILFVSRESSVSMDAILGKVAKGTLVIAEKPGCAKKGAAINFVIADNKLKFEINQKAVNAAGLKASSQLLKLAIMVDD